MILEHRAETPASAGLLLSLELIEAFLADFERRGRVPGTIRAYRGKLEQLYDLLPEDKVIGPGTLAELRSTMMVEGIPNRTINLFTAAANSLLEYCGRRELQLTDSLEQTKIIVPELTRAEYLRLLSTAKALDKERAYLLIKLFVNTGVNIRELSLVTVEAVAAGKLNLPDRGLVSITPCLREELLDHCKRSGVSGGPVFVTSAGKPLHRSVVNVEIRRLARDAQVPEEKCNPITLKRLYLATQEQIMNSLALLIEQSHDRIFETEQLSVGWETV